jgi:hypothetical protein
MRGMDSMNRGGTDMASGEMARGMPEQDGEYSGRRCVGTMAPYHESAIVEA